MKAIRFLLQIVAYAAGAGLSLFLLGISLVALLAGPASFKVGLIPWWEGAELAKVLLAAGLFGIAATALAVMGRFTWMLAIWTFAVLVTLVWGIFFSPYVFDDADHFKQSLQLAGGALTAFLGALSRVFSR